MSHSPRILQAITTRYLPATPTKGARIKATATAGSITVSLSKLNGDNGKPGWEHDEDRHREVARQLQAKLNWGNPLVAGALPNGDYVHVMVDQPKPDYSVTRKDAVFFVDDKPAFYMELSWPLTAGLQPWHLNDIERQLLAAMQAGAIRIPERLP